MLTGLFLGAGASYEIGLPLVTGLTQEFKAFWTPAKLRALNERWRIIGNAYPDDVINDVCGVLSSPALSYENILGHLELQFVRAGPHAQSYHGLYSTLIDIVYAILWSRHIQLEPFITQYLRYLDGIVGLAEANRPLWIFSLNHDLIVECLALKYGVPTTAGLPGLTVVPRRDTNGKRLGTLTLEVLDKTTLENGGPDFFQPGVRGINLLKIHGGLDLFTFHDGRDLARIHPENSSPAALIAALRSSHDELYWAPASIGRRFRPPNEEAYEDENGEVQFLRHTLLAGAFKYDSRHPQTLPEIFLRVFSRNIESLDRLVCIGYGFGDLHVNVVLRGWLEARASRILEIVSPAATTIPSDLLHVSPQVQVVKMKATEFLDRLSPKPLNNEERLVKRGLDIQRGSWS